MVVKTRGDEVEDAVLVPLAMIAVTLGSDGLAAHRQVAGHAREGRRDAARRAAQGAGVRRQAGRRRRTSGPRATCTSRRSARVLSKDVPLLVTAQRAQDILAALRLAKEFGIRIVLDGAAEAYLVLDEIKAAGVPVILHPTMARVGRRAREPVHGDRGDAAARPAIPFALQSGYEGYVPKTRVVLFEAALAAANGLTSAEALAAITIDAARILGIDERVGSLEPGKDGDLALFDGDPFEYTTHVTRRGDRRQGVRRRSGELTPSRARHGAPALARAASAPLVVR